MSKLDIYDVTTGELDRELAFLKPRLDYVAQEVGSAFDGQNILAMIRENRLRLSLFRVDARLAGYGIYGVEEHPGASWLTDHVVWIDEPFRKQGLYRAYIAILEEKAKVAGLKGVRMHALCDTPERDAMWRGSLGALGFKPTFVQFEREV
jgi:GNAT superfamily N-acetyltransferase